MELHGDFYKKLRNLSGTIYFVHMYFVALCALVLYKEDYHNLVSFFILSLIHIFCYIDYYVVGKVKKVS